MGLLSFRRKSKNRNKTVEESKHSLPELLFESHSNNESDSNESQISFHSPIADSFMMASSIPDITANNLLDEILNELPRPGKYEYRTDDNTASAENFSSSLKLVSGVRDVGRLSNADYHSANAQPYTTINESSKSCNSTEYHRVIASEHTLNAKNTSEERELNYENMKPNKSSNLNVIIDCSTMKYFKSGSSSSISSLSSTEELIPLHHISKSDPSYNKSITTCRDNDKLPLIELIPRPLNVKSTKKLNRNANKEDLSNQYPTSLATNTSTIQRSPGFVIDRMKERHRQECRRSLQWAPTTTDITVTQSVRRANSLMTNSYIPANTSLHGHRKIYFQDSRQDRISKSQQNQRMTIAPTVSNTTSPMLFTDRAPVKSYSTITSGQCRMPLLPFASEVQPRQYSKMKPIQEVPSTLETSAKVKHIRPCKKYSAVQESCSNKNEKKSPGNSVSDSSEVVGCGKTVHTKTYDGYTSLKCHAKQVTQLHHIPIVSQQKNDKPESIRHNSQQNNTAIIDKTLPGEKKGLINLNDVFGNCMNMNSKLKAEYRRMQIIHTTRSYSVPNFTQLLDKKEEELDETQRRNSLENVNSVTGSAVLISKGSLSKGEDYSTAKKNKEFNHPKKSCGHHKVNNSPHHCHHHEASIYKKHLPSCCKYVCNAEPICCNHSYHCKPIFRKAAASTKTKTPPEKSILTTSPSGSQPQVVQNVKYDNIEIDGKNLCHRNLHYRPVCKTCRH